MTAPDGVRAVHPNDAKHLTELAVIIWMHSSFWPDAIREAVMQTPPSKPSRSV